MGSALPPLPGSLGKGDPGEVALTGSSGAVPLQVLCVLQSPTGTVTEFFAFTAQPRTPPALSNLMPYVSTIPIFHPFPDLLFPGC